MSFLREKFLPKGPPNGGNGGRGGNVIVMASTDETTLRHVPRICAAKRGQHGMGGGRHGTAGEDLIIPVPVGTIVRQRPPSAQIIQEEQEQEQESEESRWVHFPRYEPQDLPEGKVNFFEQAKKMIQEEDRYLKWREAQEQQGGAELIHVDLVEPGQQVVLCHGGAGGYGNPHFLTSENRSPKFATRGRKGQVREFELELKTIADIGLVGLPNAGKSTLLGAISNAHPKQGDYAFTTLHPFVGTVDFADMYQLTVADIPGLIEGAHRNIGLGHAFLRHVERAKILVYVIDLSSERPWNDLRILQNELEAYRPGLTKRQSLVVANKADQVRLAKDNLARLQTEFNDIPIVPISARYEKNILKLTSVMRKLVEQVREQEKQQQQQNDQALK